MNSKLTEESLKRKIAEEILSYLENFDVQQLTQKGVKQANGCILRIEKNFHDISIDMGGITENDKRIFQVCLGLKDKHKDKRVVLVSKNKAIRIKARMLGIIAEDFRDDLFPTPAEQYSGRVKVTTTTNAIDNFYQKNFMDIADINKNMDITWVTNMFVEGKSIDGRQSFLGRYDGEKIVPLIFSGKRPYGAIPENIGQTFWLECLQTDWERAPLVIAKGGAGTGKTYLSLATALQGFDSKNFSRILVATPSETVGNEKLGFLPGDMKERFLPIWEEFAIIFLFLSMERKGLTLSPMRILKQVSIILKKYYSGSAYRLLKRSYHCEFDFHHRRNSKH